MIPVVPYSICCRRTIVRAVAAQRGAYIIAPRIAKKCCILVREVVVQPEGNMRCVLDVTRFADPVWGLVGIIAVRRLRCYSVKRFGQRAYTRDRDFIPREERLPRPWPRGTGGEAIVDRNRYILRVC